MSGGGVLLFSLISGWIPSGAWFQLRNVLYNSAFFYLGTRYDHGLKARLTDTRVLTLSALLAAVPLVIFWRDERSPHGYQTIPVVNFVIALCLCLFLTGLFQRVPLLGENPVLIYLGARSLEIYLLHPYFFTITRVVLFGLGIANPWPNTAAGFAAGVAGPLLTVRIMKNFAIFKKIDLYNICFRPYYFVIRKTENREKISS